MTHRLASLIGALAASAVLAAAGGAQAQSVPDAAAIGPGYTAADAPRGAATELRIDLKGRVAARCDLSSPPAGLERLAVAAAGEAQAGFGIDCNAPFVLRVRSRSGGFANAAPMPGVQALVPYELGVQVGTDNGRRDLGWCAAAELTPAHAGSCAFAPGAGGGWSSGDDVAIQQSGTLRLRWSDRDREEALLGAYRDTIVIELEVRS